MVRHKGVIDHQFHVKPGTGVPAANTTSLDKGGLRDYKGGYGFKKGGNSWQSTPGHRTPTTPPRNRGGQRCPGRRPQAPRKKERKRRGASSHDKRNLFSTMCCNCRRKEFMQSAGVVAGPCCRYPEAPKFPKSGPTKPTEPTSCNPAPSVFQELPLFVLESILPLQRLHLNVFEPRLGASSYAYMCIGIYVYMYHDTRLHMHIQSIYIYIYIYMHIYIYMWQLINIAVSRNRIFRQNQISFRGTLGRPIARTPEPQDLSRPIITSMAPMY